VIIPVTVIVNLPDSASASASPEEGAQATRPASVRKTSRRRRPSERPKNRLKKKRSKKRNRKPRKRKRLKNRLRKKRKRISDDRVSPPGHRHRIT
jgi:hypothetical protein